MAHKWTWCSCCWIIKGKPDFIPESDCIIIQPCWKNNVVKTWTNEENLKRAWKWIFRVFIFSDKQLNIQKAKRSSELKKTSPFVCDLQWLQKSVMPVSSYPALYWKANNCLVPADNVNEVYYLLGYLTIYLITKTDDYFIFNLRRLQYMLHKTVWKFAP